MRDKQYEYVLSIKREDINTVRRISKHLYLLNSTILISNVFGDIDFSKDLHFTHKYDCIHYTV